MIDPHKDTPIVRAESSLREVLAAMREKRQVGAGPTVLRAEIIHQHLTIYRYRYSFLRRKIHIYMSIEDGAR